MTPALQAQANSYANLTKGRAPKTPKPKIGSPKLPILIHSLYEGASIPELSTSTGLTRKTIQRIIDSLRKPPFKTLYISSYDLSPRGAPLVPIYTIGIKPDVPKPKPLTEAERAKKYRLKQAHINLIQATSGALNSKIRRGVDSASAS